jgi:hypothetical protein
MIEFLFFIIGYITAVTINEVKNNYTDKNNILKGISNGK